MRCVPSNHRDARVCGYSSHRCALPGSPRRTSAGFSRIRRSACASATGLRQYLTARPSARRARVRSAAAAQQHAAPDDRREQHRERRQQRPSSRRTRRTPPPTARTRERCRRTRRCRTTPRARRRGRSRTRARLRAPLWARSSRPVVTTIHAVFGIAPDSQAVRRVVDRRPRSDGGRTPAAIASPWMRRSARS